MLVSGRPGRTDACLISNLGTGDDTHQFLLDRLGRGSREEGEGAWLVFRQREATQALLSRTVLTFAGLGDLAH